MKSKVIFGRPEMTIKTAASLMAENNVGTLHSDFLLATPLTTPETPTAFLRFGENEKNNRLPQLKDLVN
jgi:CBS domain-containing protein